MNIIEALRSQDLKARYPPPVVLQQFHPLGRVADIDTHPLGYLELLIGETLARADGLD